jgi:hypothetical protein
MRVSVMLTTVRLLGRVQLRTRLAVNIGTPAR